jgi:hypothetical protein
MQLFIEISKLFFTTFVFSLFTPMFWVVLFLIYTQYRRQAAVEQKLFGRQLNQTGRQMLLSAGLGAIGGLLASFVLILLGLSLEQIGLFFIWPVALFLLLINPRYLCFSYAGSIVATGSLILRHLLLPLFPGLANPPVFAALLKIHIPALLVLIGLLHLVEALLIYSGGHQGSSPVYLKQDNGRVVGAFTLQRFWPLPLVALLVAVIAQTEIAGVNMPEWWPILKSTLQPETGQGLQYMIIPVAAGLGYADLALSSTPRERSAFSARWLAIYSLILLSMAIAAEYWAAYVLPGVIFAPLGHEMLILLGKKREENAVLRYVQIEAGVRLMMVLPGSAAAEAGLLDDDVICRVNGKEANNGWELMQAVDTSYFLVLIEGKRGEEDFSLVLRKKLPGEKENQNLGLVQAKGSVTNPLLHRIAALGLIPVPAVDSPVYLEIRKPNPLMLPKRVINKIKSVLFRK